MNINLLLDNPDGIISGYINIDPFAAEDDANRLPLDINNFDDVCSDAEANLIVANNVLTFFPGKDIDKILDYWLKKLAHNGKLVIQDKDVNAISRAIASKSISIEHINDLLYGEQKKSWDFRKCILSIPIVTEVLSTKGMKITKKRAELLEFVVEAVRP